MEENSILHLSISQEFMRRFFYENAERRMAVELYEFLFWRRGKFLRPTEKTKIINRYVEEEIDNFSIQKLLNIPRLQFFLTNACTLRCRECNALIPDMLSGSSSVKQYFLSEDDFRRDLDFLKTAVSSIRHFIFLGGEPLLHRNIHNLISIALQSGIISTIEIVTNGTVVPQKDTIEGIRKYKEHVFFRISDYSANPELAAILRHAELEFLLKKYGIRYQKTFMPWFRMHPAQVPQNDNVVRSVFRDCYMARCVQVFDGKLAICPKASAMAAMGHCSPEKCGIIDLRHEQSLRDALIHFYEQDFFEVCRMCKGYGEEVLPGEQV
ncbi:radical SAM protein [uncultured Desulfovibrio sp.]|uniref:radical SAM protein n=1 Tax=uncultured Desulfovibrio sp. TaxID=167968 RepID=UPI0025F7CB2B|nr:radical SAM protein [uncultured Desulfovibrio sp.]